MKVNQDVMTMAVTHSFIQPFLDLMIQKTLPDEAIRHEMTEQEELAVLERLSAAYDDNLLLGPIEAFKAFSDTAEQMAAKLERLSAAYDGNLLLGPIEAFKAFSDTAEQMAAKYGWNVGLKFLLVGLITCAEVLSEDAQRKLSDTLAVTPDQEVQIRIGYQVVRVSGEGPVQ